MSKLKVLCYIVSYNAAPFIERVLSNIPAACWHNDRYSFHVLISDDCSSDDTVAVCKNYIARSPYAISVQRTRHNLGYGGNQKLGYDFATANAYDAVILLHGDGQYNPRHIPELLEPILTNRADAVLGSRMLQKRDALKGGMPLYKFFGNILLTAFQNRMLGSDLSEFHTGLRGYATKALAGVPYRYNHDGYIFDTEILMQYVDAGHRIAEIPIATHYGEETCHVNGVRYAWRIIAATLAFRMHKLGFSYQRQYDYGYANYPSKIGFNSSHTFALTHASDAKTIIDAGGGNGQVVAALRQQNKRVYGFDIRPPDQHTARVYDGYTQINLDECENLTAFGIHPDAVLLLDILEHLKHPEKLLFNLRDILDDQARVIITVPNVAFFTVRLKLLLGMFSYTSRGILDHTHLRFFTYRSITLLLEQQGYAITLAKGIPAPFPLIIKSKILANLLLKLNSFLILIHKGLFSFQIGIIAKSKIISHDS